MKIKFSFFFLVVTFIGACSSNKSTTPLPTTISVAGNWSGTISCNSASGPWDGTISQSGSNLSAAITAGGSPCIYSLAGTISGSTIILNDSTYGLSTSFSVNSNGTSITSGTFTITNPPTGCPICNSSGTINGTR